MINNYQIPYVHPNLALGKKVAIVGASGNLNGSELGSLVDKYDEVIRFNRSPTNGYETDVGSKTTLRVVNNHVFNNNDITKEGYSNSPPNFVRDLRNSRILYVAPDLGPWYNRDNNCHESNDVFLFDYSNVGSLKEAFEYRDNSNFQVGTIAILLCITSGIKPDLFGFDLEPLPRTHYYQNRPKNCSVCHNVTEEQKLIIKLRDNNFLNIIKSV
jgi:hypothetical protein